jgi:hypothetical protein
MRTREKIGVGIALTFGILSVLPASSYVLPTNGAQVPPPLQQLNAIKC